MFRRRVIAALGAVALLAATAACTDTSGTPPVVTVYSTSYVPPTTGINPLGGPGGSTASTAGGSSTPGTTSSAGSSTSGSTSGSSSGSSTASTAATSGSSSALPPGAEPDGFVPTKLKPGEKPPQFIAVSFDGAGWDEKWQYWFSIAKQVPFHFTANLTGLYLMTDSAKDSYQGTGHKPGATALGGAAFWAGQTPDVVKQEILDLNRAVAEGDEIGTHYMGHFCDDDPPGANTWTTAAWKNDLKQFFDVLQNYKTIDNDPNLPTLNLKPSDIKGERTPCLEGTQEALYPATTSYGLTYDQSFTRRGIVWPTKSPQYKVWQMGMAEFPLHGNTPGYGPNHFQITMDYNFWYTQEYNPSTQAMNKTTVEQSNADAAQVMATYQDMLDGALAGGHQPLLLGNHFNDWNNNAYTVALANFLLANCGKPGIYCVPYRDVIDWMNMQDPAVLAQLQSLPPVLGPPGSTNH